MKKKSKGEMNYVEKKKHRIGNEKIVDCIERVEEKKKYLLCL
jgi:hypothetical protein